MSSATPGKHLRSGNRVPATRVRLRAPAHSARDTTTVPVLRPARSTSRHVSTPSRDHAASVRERDCEARHGHDVGPLLRRSGVGEVLGRFPPDDGARGNPVRAAGAGSTAQGELAGSVAERRVEPFVGPELAPLLSAPSPADVTTAASRCSTASIPATVAQWLRQGRRTDFTSKPEQQKISAQVFRDAADPNAAPFPRKRSVPRT